QLGDVVQALSNSKRIFIIGLRNAYPVALHLRQQLLQARAQVHLLPQPGQTLAEELVNLAPGDLVVVMAFRRRPRIIRPLLLQLQQLGIPTLALCEPQAQGVIALARWQLCAPLDSVSAFDSYAAANSLINLLANTVLHELLSDGRQRIHQIADLYSQLDELKQR
ncbi:MurR/RpiR family transcriptional regulator, partial [Candidatus Erwinia dacicola]